MRLCIAIFVNCPNCPKYTRAHAWPFGTDSDDLFVACSTLFNGVSNSFNATTLSDKVKPYVPNYQAPGKDVLEWTAPWQQNPPHPGAAVPTHSHPSSSETNLMGGHVDRAAPHSKRARTSSNKPRKKLAGLAAGVAIAVIAYMNVVNRVANSTSSEGNGAVVAPRPWPQSCPSGWRVEESISGLSKCAEHSSELGHFKCFIHSDLGMDTGTVVHDGYNNNTFIIPGGIMFNTEHKCSCDGCTNAPLCGGWLAPTGINSQQPDTNPTALAMRLPGIWKREPPRGQYEPKRSWITTNTDILWGGRGALWLQTAPVEPRWASCAEKTLEHLYSYNGSIPYAPDALKGDCPQSVVSFNSSMWQYRPHEDSWRRIPVMPSQLRPGPRVTPTAHWSDPAAVYLYGGWGCKAYNPCTDSAYVTSSCTSSKLLPRDMLYAPVKQWSQRVQDWTGHIHAAVISNSFMCGAGWEAVSAMFGAYYFWDKDAYKTNKMDELEMLRERDQGGMLPPCGSLLAVVDKASTIFRRIGPVCFRFWVK